MDFNALLLEALSRILKLEKEVDSLKTRLDQIDKQSAKVSEEFATPLADQNEKDDVDKATITTRDKTRYLFNGVFYLKNRLVLAVVKDYVQNHPEITIAELKKVFDKSLQGSFGVVEDVEIAKKRYDYKVRYFADENELLEVSDGTVCVCSQWGILNITKFLTMVESNLKQYNIEKI